MKTSEQTIAGADTKNQEEKYEGLTEQVMELLLQDLPVDFDIDQIEFRATQVLNRIRKLTTEKMIATRDPKSHCCGECKQPMKIKERVKNSVQGLVRYEYVRRSFHCEPCNTYEKPLDALLNIRGEYTLAVGKSMLLLGQRMPFAESSDLLEKLLGLSICDEAVRKLVEGVGSKIAADETKLVQETINEDGNVKVTALNTHKPAQIKGTAYLELDACMVQTRELKWKEVRNGILFDQKDNIRVDKHHRRIFSKKYFSVFNHGTAALNDFLNRATQEAHAFGFDQYENQVILGDGAPYIWNYAEMYHPNATQILDYYHASEYLGEAVKTIPCKIDEERVARDEKLFGWLESGQIQSVLDFLKTVNPSDEVKKCMRYFENNISRMDYGAYRANGFDVGSGAIESAHRTIIQTRMKQSGMHWGKDNVQSIASLRAKYLSNEWGGIIETYLKKAA